MSWLEIWVIIISFAILEAAGYRLGYIDGYKKGHRHGKCKQKPEY